MDKFNLLTVTGTISNSETDGEQLLEVEASGEIRSVAICGRGRKCSKGAVDYFTLDIERFDFTSKCIRKEDFEGAKLKLKSVDGWYVASAYLFADTCETHELITANNGLNKWVDDPAGKHEVPLTNV